MGERLAAAAVFVGLSVGVAGLAGVGLTPTGVGVLLPGLAAACLWIGMLAISHRVERPALVAATVLVILQLGFAVGAVRIAALALVLGATTTASPMSLLLPGSLLLAAGLLALVWAGLDRHALEPSPAAKSSLAFVGLAMSCTCLATGLEWATPGEPLASAAMIASLVTLLLGHAIAGPDCVRALRELPKRMRGAGMTSWVLALVCSHALARTATLPGEPTPAFSACLTLGFAALAAAVLCSFVWRPMLALAHTRPHDDGPSDALVHRPTPGLDATL